jgi:erythromycin esterase-like protein
MRDADLVSVVQQHAVAVDPEAAAAPLLQMIDPAATVVLIGEATHGTREFYRIRADLTRALIRERGFGIVAVEADWPDAYRANAWVRLAGADETAESALADFTRFPRWMWRNREVVRFLRWLRAENSARDTATRVGSTDWISTACIGPWHVSSNTWTRSIPQRRGALARDTPASTLWRGRPALRLYG